MRKLAIAFAFAGLLVAAVAGTALADNGPHGGSAFSTGTTAACAGCHRPHTGQDTNSAGSMLLATSTEYDLCVSCHDGSGAYTNVVNGIYENTGWNTTNHGPAPSGVVEGTSTMGLFGGGFVNAKMAHGYDGSQTYSSGLSTSLDPVTGSGIDYGLKGSAHPVGQPNEKVWGVYWGAGALGAGAGTTTLPTTTLECVSCHDPHGRAGLDGTAKVPSYRILRYTPENSGGYTQSGGSSSTYGATAAGYTVADQQVSITDNTTTHWYTPNTKDTVDPSVAVYRISYRDGVWSTEWTLMVQGPNDYPPRANIYQRPFVNGDPGDAASYWTTSSGSVNLIYSCVKPDAPNQGNLPAIPSGSIAAAVEGTHFFKCAAAKGSIAAGAQFYTPGRAMLGKWCSTCHDRYASASSSGRKGTGSGDILFKYRHTSTGSYICLDCHVAHGTSAVVTGYAASTPFDSGDVDHPAPSDSALMRRDNRGICLGCHGTAVNFQWKTGTIPAMIP